MTFKLGSDYFVMNTYQLQNLVIIYGKRDVVITDMEFKEQKRQPLIIRNIQSNYFSELPQWQFDAQQLLLYDGVLYLTVQNLLFTVDLNIITYLDKIPDTTPTGYYRGCVHCNNLLLTNDRQIFAYANQSFEEIKFKYNNVDLKTLNICIVSFGNQMLLWDINTRAIFSISNNICKVIYVGRNIQCIFNNGGYIIFEIGSKLFLAVDLNCNNDVCFNFVSGNYRNEDGVEDSSDSLSNRDNQVFINGFLQYHLEKMKYFFPNFDITSQNRERFQKIFNSDQKIEKIDRTNDIQKLNKFGRSQFKIQALDIFKINSILFSKSYIGLHKEYAPLHINGCEVESDGGSNNDNSDGYSDSYSSSFDSDEF